MRALEKRQREVMISPFLSSVLALGMLFYPLVVWPTLFMPISLKNQIEESTAVIYGKFLKKNSKLLSSTGEVVTVASFHLLGSAGLKRNEMLNNNEFQVMYPGGEWQGIVYEVQGAPKFVLGEEVVLLLSKNGEGLWVHNLALGKYHWQKSNNRWWLISTVFPQHPRFGRTSKEKFNNLLMNKYGEILSNKKDEKVVDKNPSRDLDESNILFHQDQQKRSLASLPTEGSESENDKGLESESEHDGVGNFWPIMILAILVVISTLLVRNQKKEKNKPQNHDV